MFTGKILRLAKQTPPRNAANYTGGGLRSSGSTRA